MIFQTFFHHYLRVFIKPGKTFSEAISEKNALGYGFIGLLIPSIGYMLFYIMAYSAGGAPSTFKPWLAVPIERYFYYGIYLSIPGYCIAVFTATSVGYLLSKLFGSHSTWDKLLCVNGLSVGVATWSTLLHDITDAFLAFIGVIDMKAYEAMMNAPTFWRYLLLTLMSIYVVWFIVLFVKGVRAVTQLAWRHSLVIGFVSFCVFQLVLLIFIR
jgi:Yip1 domain